VAGHDGSREGEDGERVREEVCVWVAVVEFGFLELGFGFGVTVQVGFGIEVEEVGNWLEV
jgi:hypothetical protein